MERHVQLSFVSSLAVLGKLKQRNCTLDEAAPSWERQNVTLYNVIC